MLGLDSSSQEEMENIIIIKNSGTYDDQGTIKQCVIIWAKKGVDLHHFAIYDDTYDDEENVSNKHQHFYRFPTYQMPEDSDVILVVQGGEGDLRNGDDTWKTFYMGLGINVFNAKNDTVHLVSLVPIQDKKFEIN